MKTFNDVLPVGNEQATNEVKVAGKRTGRPVGTRKPETIAAEREYAAAQLAKLEVRLADNKAELEVILAKIEGFKANLTN